MALQEGVEEKSGFPSNRSEQEFDSVALEDEAPQQPETASEALPTEAGSAALLEHSEAEKQGTSSPGALQVHKGAAQLSISTSFHLSARSTLLCK